MLDSTGDGRTTFGYGAFLFISLEWRCRKDSEPLRGIDNYRVVFYSCTEHALVISLGDLGTTQDA